VLLVAVVVGLGLMHSFLQELKSRHPNVWESLGRPSVVANNSIANSLAVLRFLWRKEYKDLGDPNFANRATVVRKFNIAYLTFLQRS
jgi:hypothetical protein